MTRKAFNLDDIQHLLLSVAATRPDGSLIPPSDILGDLSDRIRTAIGGLIRRKLAMEFDVATVAQSWRSKGDRLIGIMITDAGRAAITIDAKGIANADASSTESVPPEPADPRPVTKQARLIDLLHHPDGATLADLCQATGWLPHTSRAFLSGLRKKGRVLERDKRADGMTIYRLASIEVVA